MNKHPVYLGDGVYASYDGYHIWLRTGSHENPEGQIALDPSVYHALVQYQERLATLERQETEARMTSAYRGESLSIEDDGREEDQ